MCVRFCFRSKVRLKCFVNCQIFSPTTLSRPISRPSTMTSKSGKSNVALLTEGQSYIQRAKKARREQIEEIKFDHDARRCVFLSSEPSRCTGVTCLTMIVQRMVERVQ